MRKYFRVARFILVLLVILYLIPAAFYYYRQKHLFDPYLQAPAPRFKENQAKGENVFRILCLGGSTTLCAKLPKDKRYPQVLRKILAERYPSVKFEVFNAGMDWYTTKHSLINYVTYCNRYEADLVIVMHAVNDLQRSFSPPKWAHGKYNDSWTHFYGPSIKGAKPPTFLEHAYDWITFALSMRLPGLNPRKSLGMEKAFDYPSDRYLSIGMFRKHLKAIVKYVESDNASVVLVSQPSLYKEAMTKEELEALWIGRKLCYARQGFLRTEYPSHRSLRRAMEAFNSVTEEAASSGGVIFVDAAKHVPKNLDNLMDDCHYTGKGARLLAEVIADAVTVGTRSSSRPYQNPHRGGEAREKHF